jgi:hypothetical protein
MIPSSCPISNKEKLKVVLNLKCKLQAFSAVEFKNECEGCSFNYYNYQKKMIEQLMKMEAEIDEASKKHIALVKNRGRNDT